MAPHALLFTRTSRQLRLDFAMTRLALSDEPPGFAVHALLDGELSSHVQQVRPS